MDGLHLILHKVRGQAAIDVAQRVVIGDEDVWLIPTSGHRAYPLRWQPLPESLTESLSADTIEGSDWAALPDHYPDVEQDHPSLVARLRSAPRWVVGNDWLALIVQWEGAFTEARRRELMWIASAFVFLDWYSSFLPTCRAVSPVPSS